MRLPVDARVSLVVKPAHAEVDRTLWFQQLLCDPGMLRHTIEHHAQRGHGLPIGLQEFSEVSVSSRGLLRPTHSVLIGETEMFKQ
jgi:hypothetical protein